MALENEFSKDKPLLTTSIVAKILEITPDRLRTYDAEKLIKTHRLKTGEVQKRLYSQYDVEWLKCLRLLIKEHKMSISSIKFLLKVISQNSKINMPQGEISEILIEMSQNPNFKQVVDNF